MGLGAGDPEGHGFERKYLSFDEQGSFRGLYGRESTATRCGSGRSPGDSWKIWCSRVFRASAPTPSYQGR